MREASRPAGRLAAALLLVGVGSLGLGCSLIVKTDDLSSGGGALDHADTGVAPGDDGPAGDDTGRPDTGDDDSPGVIDSAADTSVSDATTPDAGTGSPDASDGGARDAGAA